MRKNNKSAMTVMGKILAMCVVMGMTVSAGEVKTEKYVGRATDLKSGAFLYTEEHTAFYEDGRHRRSDIEYRDAAGKVIGRKQIDLSDGSAAATFRREDYRYGTVESATKAGGKYRLTSKADAASEERTAEISISGTAAIDAGLNNLVRSRWEELERGGTVNFQLGVPSQLDHFAFRVRTMKTETVNGRSAMLVRFESDHWYIRLFVDPVLVWYDTATRRALRYEGISNLYDEKGKSYVVRVEFDRPGP